MGWLNSRKRPYVESQDDVDRVPGETLNYVELKATGLFSQSRAVTGATASSTAGSADSDAALEPFPTLSARQWLLKGIIDKILASLILLLASPLMLLLAIGVKLSSPGPVLFRQLRHGWGDKPIEIWKFRSMRLHDEGEGVLTQAARDDSRVTPFGAFMRRNSLDELPQFFNVLQGRMSIVGPRPHALAHHRHYKDLITDYLQRHRVKPGITGWAQVNGLRGETPTLEKMHLRVQHDLYYIRHWSLLFDLRIIFRTIVIVVFDDNAY